MARVYLETSYFSFCVTKRTSDLDIGRRASSLLWWETQSHRHDLFISAEVIDELSVDTFPQRDEALAMLRGLTELNLTDEIIGIAELLVHERVMPGPAVAGDALHIAFALYHHMEYVLTWNIKHLANPNKRTHLAVIAMRLGLVPPQIVTPDMLQEIYDE